MSPEKNMPKADEGNTQNAQKPKKRRHKLVKKFINEKSIPESLTPEKKSIMAMSCKGGSYSNCGYGSYQRGDGYRNYQGDNGYGNNHQGGKGRGNYRNGKSLDLKCHNKGKDDSR